MSTIRPRRHSGPSRDAGEPSLAELLDDPVLQILMARDNVGRAELEELIANARRRLAFGTPQLYRPEIADILFADCRS